MSLCRSSLMSLAAVFLVAGCGANNSKVHQLIVPPGLVDGDDAKPVTKPAAPPVDKMDANITPPDVLAKKTAALAKQLEAMQTPATAPKLPVNPSAVEFADNSSNAAFSLTPKSNNPVRNTAEVIPLPLVSDAVTPPPAVDPLTKKLQQRVAENPRDVSSQLENQLLGFLQDKQTPDPNGLASLPSDDRELLSTLLDGLSNFRNNLRADNNMMMSAKVSPLLIMADRLRTESDLTTPTLEVCDSVKHFGDYHPMDTRLPAGKENAMIIYCEVANFMSNLNTQQQWETHLKFDVTLYSEGGQMVWSSPTTNYDETTRTRRHDYYIAKLVKIPGNLPPGKYVLKVGVTDAQSSHISEHSKDLAIIAGAL